MSIEEIEKRLCDSCEKEYPKKLMTRVKKWFTHFKIYNFVIILVCDGYKKI